MAGVRLSWNRHDTTTRALVRAVAVFFAYACVLGPVMLAVLFVSMLTTG